MAYAFPTLREAVRLMVADSSGWVMSDLETTQHVACAWTVFGQERLQETEDWLLYLDESGDLDSPWECALCGDDMQEIVHVPLRIGQVLNELFDPVAGVTYGSE